MNSPATIGDVVAIVIAVPALLLVALLVAAAIWGFGNSRGWWE